MDDTSRPTVERLRVVRYFAPWRWKRRWLAVVAVPALLLGYVLSLGPALSLVGHGLLSGDFVAFAYRPVLMMAVRLPSSACNAAEGYLRRWDRRALLIVLGQHRHCDFQAWRWMGPSRPLLIIVEEEGLLGVPID